MGGGPRDRWRGGRAARELGGLRPHRARHAAAGQERPRRAPVAAREGLRAAGARAHRAGRRGREGRDAARRRRRLRHQAVRVRGAARARRSARAAAALARVARADGGRPRDRSGDARGAARRRAHRADAQGIHGARVSRAPRGPRDEPHAHHRVRVGLSLRSRHEHRGRRDQPPAQEDRRRSTSGS